MSKELLIYLEVSAETFKGLGEAVSDPRSEWLSHPEPVRLFSGDTRRHLRIGNVVFIENTPVAIKVEIS